MDAIKTKKQGYRATMTSQSVLLIWHMSENFYIHCPFIRSICLVLGRDGLWSFDLDLTKHCNDRLKMNPAAALFHAVCDT